ncbi:SLAM family member 9 [Danio aesculapii]|uniref:SLAM family member 9 n=1 Tax=Danio aesculapii TaxID=1142201 RepID=UPI0024BFDEC1|nr:SLAM family member 9 [Danio aesculapii]
MSPWRKMFCALVWFCFCFERRSGVFGVETNEIKLVLEGDTVTLPAEIHRDEQLLWRFGLQGTIIAKFNKKNRDYEIMKTDERFSGRLTAQYETGSLIIRNIRTEHAGLYQLQIISSTVSTKTFNVSVYARLPIPVITRDYSLCSSSTSSPSSSAASQCLLVCSVLNVSAVSLSWYKGNSLFSRDSVSDLSSSFSLPLEVEYQDKNTYSCVVNNPVSNQTTHLDIDTLCQPCPAPLPIPIIATDSPQCPSSSSLQNCSLLCSVLNVSAVSLSWYKGNSVLSSISVSDLRISLSLPLEVEYQDKNTYSCVINNTISNQTTHLDIHTLCQSCSDRVHCCGFTETVIRLVASAVVGVAVIAVLVYDVRSSRSYQKRRLQTVSGQADDYDDVATAH